MNLCCLPILFPIAKVVEMSQFDDIRQKYLALAARDKFNLMMAGLIFLGFINYLFVLKPHLTAHTKLNLDLKQAKTQLLESQNKLADLRRQQQTHLEKVHQSQTLHQDMKIWSPENKFPEFIQQQSQQLLQVIENLLKQHQGIKLVNFENLEAKILFDNPIHTADNNSAKKPTLVNSAAILYQQGISIKIHGGYWPLVAFLNHLEKQKLQILWDEIQLEVIKYPVSMLTLNIHTLSLGDPWLVM